jgi:hypothetical protein
MIKPLLFCFEALANSAVEVSIPGTMPGQFFFGGALLRAVMCSGK